MKLLILSDLHLESAAYDLPAGLAFDAIVLAGDICDSGVQSVLWAARPEFNQGKPVFFVPGNHEFYSRSMAYTFMAMQEAAEGTLVQIMDRKAVILDGVRLLGCTLWTDFNLGIGNSQESDPAKAMAEAQLYLMDYREIMPYFDDFKFLKPQDTRDFHNTQRHWLLSNLKQPFEGKTVVITHHAPHRASLAEKYASDWCSPAYISELPDMAFQVPTLWVHGHTHTPFDYTVGSCRVVCNPRGYRSMRTGRFEVTGFNPALIIEV